MRTERVDAYKHRFSRYVEAAEVKRGQPYRIGEGWGVTTPTPKVPYNRPVQKRRAEKIIEKALEES